MTNSLLKYLSVIIILIHFSSCKTSSKIPSSTSIKAINNKVADWQINTFEDMGKYRALPPIEKRKNWHTRIKHHELDWTNAALYSGMFQWGEIAGDNSYLEWLNSIAEKNDWQLLKRKYHADDHAVGQLYLKLKTVYGNSHGKRKTHLEQRFDSILIDKKKDKLHWDWCDALFMAPPVWAKLAKQKNDATYLNYMHSQYKKTYDLLWDKEEALFYRDANYFDKREKNAKKIFWSRGNGWVFGGLALMIPDFPKDWEHTNFYINTFKEMANTLKRTQRKDGTWSSGILGDLKTYENIETSGTSFFVFGLAWGINQNILDKATYEPVLLKGWNALVNAVNQEGMLTYVQGIGAQPGVSYKDYSEVYGTGAFLAAGSEMYKYAKKNELYLSKNAITNTSVFTFMKDGGWCWYQDPRAIIKNNKVVLGGLSGQTGDVKVSVFDLKNKENEGEYILHKNFQKDDHNVPAFFTRKDGSILAFWAKHGSEKKHYYSTTSSNNYLDWNTTKEFNHEYEETFGVTYMNLHYMENENLLYNFFRDGPTYNPSFITSKDNGETWGNRSHFIADDVEGRQRPYAKYLQKDANTVGVSFTDGHPRNYGNSLYYAEFKNNAFYKADGTLIKKYTSTPLFTSEAEKIFIGSETKEKPEYCESVPNSAWTCTSAKDKNNNPYIGYTLYINNNDHRYRVAHWNGKKWIDKEIAYAGTCLYSIESSYTGLMDFDPEDPSMVYISTDVNPNTGKATGGTHEIYSAKINSNDTIETIAWKPITQNSEYRNIRPIIVANEGKKVLLWLNGVWNSFINYNVDVKGIILE
ncbi:rhamnogalacturonyl hydrolase YesR [Maribacter vaceletii]|uniref:Rhamnogalacturonyl hydrolase YesR n=1 Tax=Maribacter vaceletii TaxID=1206816 RepID=A0A495EBL4_9FLAO|nr:glycoside hydrolase family 88 protein [Maribacter vaceletii]RKR13287.1 rhamnogalacturonyl hydrolase YesR [Maribacter vaceletii]